MRNFYVKKIISDEYDLVMSEVQLNELKEVLKRPKFNNYISAGEVD